MENQEYAVWDDDFGSRNYGCRHRLTGKEHGIVRSFKIGDSIVEASFKNGVRHGLCRQVCADEVAIQLYVQDEEVAYFRFGRWFKETIRYGEMKDKLADLGPQDFQLPDGFDPD